MILAMGAVSAGMVLAFLALGVYISFRIFDFPDITADGSYTLGAVICASCIAGGMNPFLATALAFAGGFGAGAITGTLHTRFAINKLLAGILVMTALYSLNLHILGSVSDMIPYEKTILVHAEKLAAALVGEMDRVEFLGVDMRLRDIVQFFSALILIPLLVWLMHLFFRTHLGLAMRATGDNARMARALGVDDARMITLGLALSNGLIALSGAHMAQLMGQVDIQMGIGMIVIGLASVILGGSLIRSARFGHSLIATVLGSVLFRLVVALVFWLGLGTTDLKLFTALFVFAALVVPEYLRKIRSGKHHQAAT